MWVQTLVLCASVGVLPTTRVTPNGYREVRRYGSSSLYEIVMNGTQYASGVPQVVKLSGNRFEVGRAYAFLLGNETLATFDRFLAHIFPNAAVVALFERFADWLWDEFAVAHVPEEYLRELEGMRSASSTVHGAVDLVSRRFNVLANLPADPQNLISMLEQELEKGCNPAVAALLNAIIAQLDGCSWCEVVPGTSRRRLPFSPGCDAFAVWGSRTRDGALRSSRNLDWGEAGRKQAHHSSVQCHLVVDDMSPPPIAETNTGINQAKLIMVFDIEGTRSGPYATFGFAAGFGALAGMSAKGLSVSEMNLDNSRTTFDGPPFPTRLRMVLERATDLAEARALWEATNNTDSMNFMIASAVDGAALAIEAIGGEFSVQPPHAAFSAFFTDNDPVEANATCIAGDDAAGRCGDGFPDIPVTPEGLKRIGMPLTEAVWRTNHAMHPTITKHQEPLFNETTFRYELLRSLFDEAEQSGPAAIDDAVAVGMAATLGVKGPNYFSCDPAQFTSQSAAHVMSVVYAPPARAWVAWEDSTPDGNDWRPAACNPYILVDFASHFW